MFYVVAERKRGERGTGQIAVLSTPKPNQPERRSMLVCTVTFVLVDISTSTLKIGYSLSSSGYMLILSLQIDRRRFLHRRSNNIRGWLPVKDDF